MSRSNALSLVVTAALALAAASPAAASFHLMQIEQVGGSFCGDPAAQAIQLRMRSGGQNLVAGSRLVAYDAAGANPVTLILFPANAPTGTAGSRILVATSAFAAVSGTATPDFTMLAPIPASYLAAGRIGFEAGASTFWSLAWGGAGYTGTNVGTLDNDPDGNFNPPFGSAMPEHGAQAILFPGVFNAASTNNAADYVLSAEMASWTNNSGSVGAADGCLFDDDFESGDTDRWTEAQP